MKDYEFGLALGVGNLVSVLYMAALHYPGMAAISLVIGVGNLILWRVQRPKT